MSEQQDNKKDNKKEGFEIEEEIEFVVGTVVKEESQAKTKGVNGGWIIKEIKEIKNKKKDEINPRNFFWNKLIDNYKKETEKEKKTIEITFIDKNNEKKIEFDDNNEIGINPKINKYILKIYDYKLDDNYKEEEVLNDILLKQNDVIKKQKNQIK